MVFGIRNLFFKNGNTGMQETLTTVEKVGDNKNLLTGKEMFKQSLF